MAQNFRPLVAIHAGTIITLVNTESGSAVDKSRFSAGDVDSDRAVCNDKGDFQEIAQHLIEETPVGISSKCGIAWRIGAARANFDLKALGKQNGSLFDDSP